LGSVLNRSRLGSLHVSSVCCFAAVTENSEGKA